MIYTYATTEQQGTALSLGIMVGLCLLAQLFLVWLQTHKGPKRGMLKEMLIVLSGMKPGVDAKRVADGNVKAEFAVLQPDVELTATRSIELICESIPGTTGGRVGEAASKSPDPSNHVFIFVRVGTVLQLFALIKYMQEHDGDYSRRALTSVIVSACATGFTSATISFDFDVSPLRRREEPGFYGYIPDSAGRRTAIFFCMVMNSTLLLLLRSVSTALLAMVNRR
jgi:hypothetical protein